MTIDTADEAVLVVLPARPGLPTAASPPTPLFDHVRSHSTRCYWDHVQCRWACSRD